MVLKDPAWDVFVTELKHWQDRRRCSAPQLADKLGDDVDAEVVGNWRKGRARPRLAQLQRISEALGMGSEDENDYDPLYLLRAMGMLAPEPDQQLIVDTAYRLQKLELKQAEVIDRAAALGRRAGAAGVVQAATRTGAWAAASWPAIEGPWDCRMHVADRIDIRRCNREPDAGDAPITHEEVWRDPEIKAALRAAYAVPGSRSPRWTELSDRTVSHWAISHVGSPLSPAVSSPYQGLQALSFTALTVGSWVNDVASLVAIVLGYGVTTTRDLAMEFYGLHSGATLSSQRNTIHHGLLTKPPRRRAWSHHAIPGPESPNPFQAPGVEWWTGIVHVWLREDDEVLQRWLARPERETETWEQLRAALDDVQAQSEQVPNSKQLIVVDVRDYERPEQRWSQVLETVHVVLEELVQRGFLLADLSAHHRRIHQDDPYVARPVLDWLRKRGCRAVQ